MQSWRSWLYRPKALMTCRFATVSVTFAPQLDQVHIARAALDSLARENTISASVTARLQIILDELVSNIILHGQSEQNGAFAPIQATINLTDQTFTMSLIDTSPCFDPSVAAYCDGSDRPRIGGRGLELVQALVDQITHTYQDGKNQTTITKKVTTQGESGIKMKPPGLEIEEARAEGTATVILAGRIDSGNAAQLTEHLTGLVSDGHANLTLDLRRLEYLTSAGFRTLLVVSDAAEEAGGDLMLSQMSEQVRELFDLSGLSQAFAIS